MEILSSPVSSSILSSAYNRRHRGRNTVLIFMIMPLTMVSRLFATEICPMTVAFSIRLVMSRSRPLFSRLPRLFRAVQLPVESTSHTA